MVSIILFIVFGGVLRLWGFTKIGYVCWTLSIIMICYVLVNIRKYRSYKGWKEAERGQTESLLIKKEKCKKSAEENTPDKTTEPEAIIPVESYMLKKYRRRQEESRNFIGLFYPEIETHELPSGYNNILVPSYVVYDLETTGLTPTHDEILEIGAIRIVNDEITGVFHEYICPDCIIPEKITKINGITNDMVKDCRSIKEVLPDFIAFTERLPMVAYNAEFDYSFLKEAQIKINGKKFIRKHYCAMKIYKKYHKEIFGDNPISAKLTDAVKEILGKNYYNEFIKTNHKSLIDTSATQFIFESIADVWNR